jgi:hypothetical protein
MMNKLRLLLLVALAINYTSILTLLSIWHDIYVVYLLSVVTSLLFGFVMEKIEDLVVLMLLAYVIGSFGSMLVVASPALLSGVSMVVIEVGMFGTVGTLIFNSIIIVPLCGIAGLVGLGVSDRYIRGSRAPAFAVR